MIDSSLFLFLSSYNAFAAPIFSKLLNQLIISTLPRIFLSFQLLEPSLWCTLLPSTQSWPFFSPLLSSPPLISIDYQLNCVGESFVTSFICELFDSASTFPICLDDINFISKRRYHIPIPQTGFTSWCINKISHSTKILWMCVNVAALWESCNSEQIKTFPPTPLWWVDRSLLQSVLKMRHFGTFKCPDPTGPFSPMSEKKKERKKLCKSSFQLHFLSLFWSLVHLLCIFHSVSRLTRLIFIFLFLFFFFFFFFFLPILILYFPHACFSFPCSHFWFETIIQDRNSIFFISQFVLLSHSFTFFHFLSLSFTFFHFRFCGWFNFLLAALEFDERKSKPRKQRVKEGREKAETVFFSIVFVWLEKKGKERKRVERKGEDELQWQPRSINK